MVFLSFSLVCPSSLCTTDARYRWILLKGIILRNEIKKLFLILFSFSFMSSAALNNNFWWLKWSMGIVFVFIVLFMLYLSLRLFFSSFQGFSCWIFDKLSSSVIAVHGNVNWVYVYSPFLQQFILCAGLSRGNIK